MPRHDYITIIPMADDPDMAVAQLGDNTLWDHFTEMAEIEHRRLMVEDKDYRRHITAARVLWAIDARS